MSNVFRLGFAKPLLFQKKSEISALDDSVRVARFQALGLYGAERDSYSPDLARPLLSKSCTSSLSCGHRTLQ